MKSIVYIMNVGMYEVEVDGDEVFVRECGLETYDGEFWTVEFYEEDAESLELPEELAEDGVDMSEVMECLVLPHLGFEGETWVEIA